MNGRPAYCALIFAKLSAVNGSGPPAQVIVAIRSPAVIPSMRRRIILARPIQAAGCARLRFAVPYHQRPLAIGQRQRIVSSPAGLRQALRCAPGRPAIRRVHGLQNIRAPVEFAPGDQHRAACRRNGCMPRLRRGIAKGHGRRLAAGGDAFVEQPWRVLPWVNQTRWRAPRPSAARPPP